jgi:DNA-binding winged helix-turn-helix (wHTH) protein
MADGTQPAGGAIRVGDFTVDPRSGELRSEAGRQTLSAQPLHVLLALIDHPGDLVTRDELRARLWPADTYVDFEHGLNAIVKRLRDALGDSADTPRYIETVPRRGYRLVAPVHLHDQHILAPGSGPSSEASPPAPVARPHPGLVATPPSHRRVPRSIAVIGACVLAVAGLSYSVR